jgi:4-amino-4-deoxy-L-arabinose transferase-like glycosyltransferase
MKTLLRAARWPAGVFLLALLPRLIDLGTRPFWLDEVFTFQRASLSPRALVQDSFLNHHMPSFFLMLSPLVGLGNPQFWLRFPSAVFGALAVMLVFMIATRVAGRTAGAVAALIIGLSPTALAFSQEARSYTLEMALILFALYGVTLLALDLAAAAKPMLSKHADHRPQAAWAVFILGSAVALDVLGDGLPWLITANIIFAALLVQAPDRRGLLRNFLIADAIIAICCAPFYALMLQHQDKGFVDSVMWIPPLNLSRLWYDFGSVYFMHVADSVTFRFMDVPTPWLVVRLIEAGLVVAVLASGWVLRRRPAMLAVLGVSFVFLPLMLTVISIWRPVLLPRYILWSAAPFAILAGIGASALLSYAPPRLRVAMVSCAGILLLTNMAPYYHAETKPRWDVAAKMLARDVAPGDVVYLYDAGALPILKLYLPPGTQTVVLNDSNGDLQHAELAQSQGKRVWAVFGHAGQSADNKGMMKFYATAGKLGSPQMMQIAGHRIFIALYTPITHGVVANCAPATVLDASRPAGCS